MAQIVDGRRASGRDWRWATRSGGSRGGVEGVQVAEGGVGWAGVFGVVGKGFAVAVLVLCGVLFSLVVFVRLFVGMFLCVDFVEVGEEGREVEAAFGGELGGWCDGAVEGVFDDLLDGFELFG